MVEVDALVAEQKRLDELTKEHAREVVEAQRLETLYEALQFAQSWVGTAMQSERNAVYWRTRAGEAEAELARLKGQAAHGN